MSLRCFVMPDARSKQRFFQSSIAKYAYSIDGARSRAVGNLNKTRYQAILYCYNVTVHIPPFILPHGSHAEPFSDPQQYEEHPHGQYLPAFSHHGLPKACTSSRTWKNNTGTTVSNFPGSTPHGPCEEALDAALAMNVIMPLSTA